MKKIIVLAPYEKYLLKAMRDLNLISDVKYHIIGEKQRIIKTCIQNDISYNNFIIYDIEGEIEICLYAKTIIEDEDILIFGNIPSIYHQKVLSVNSTDDIGTIYVADVPEVNNLLFISSGTKSKYSEFEDKKRAIIQADALMKSLDIRKTNAVIVTNSAIKNDVLESKIIKMILKDEAIENLNVFDFYNLKEIFGEGSKNNIFKNEINLLVMKNYEVTKVFIDSLNVFMKCKIAYFLTSSKHLVIDALEASNYDNVLFSLFIIDKVMTKTIKKKLSIRS